MSEEATADVKAMEIRNAMFDGALAMQELQAHVKQLYLFSRIMGSTLQMLSKWCATTRFERLYVIRNSSVRSLHSSWAQSFSPTPGMDASNSSIRTGGADAS